MDGRLIMCTEADYANDVLIDEYWGDIDRYFIDGDEDSYPYIPVINMSWQESMERHGFIKSSLNSLWEVFKTQLDTANHNGIFLLQKTNGDIKDTFKIVHETAKAILVQKWNDKYKQLIPGQSLWIPRSLLYFRENEVDRLKVTPVPNIYVPWFYTVKYI